MRPPEIKTSTEEERRQYIKDTFPCIADCDMCGLCTVSRKRSGTCLCGLYQREAELSGGVRGLPVIVVIASKVYFNPDL